jgi:hypothetical protein
MKSSTSDDPLVVRMGASTTAEQRVGVYRRAAELLDRDGWTAGSDRGLNFEYCVAAAVNYVAGRHLSMASPDLFEPLAVWLIDNRRDEIVKAHRYLGYPTNESVMESVLRKEFNLGNHGDPVSTLVRPIRVVTRWNDARPAEYSGAGVAGYLRTRDSATAVLREIAAGVSEVPPPEPAE